MPVMSTVVEATTNTTSAPKPAAPTSNIATWATVVST
jgi:hypothetical protein